MSTLNQGGFNPTKKNLRSENFLKKSGYFGTAIFQESQEMHGRFFWGKGVYLKRSLICSKNMFETNSKIRKNVENGLCLIKKVYNVICPINVGPRK